MQRALAREAEASQEAKACLIKACLIKACLIKACLIKACLIKACLIKALLIKALLIDARLIKAQGEQAAAETLVSAARAIGSVPGALEPRRRQTIVGIGAEHNSTSIIAMPTEFRALAARMAGT